MTATDIEPTDERMTLCCSAPFIPETDHCSGCKENTVEDTSVQYEELVEALRALMLDRRPCSIVGRGRNAFCSTHNVMSPCHEEVADALLARIDQGRTA
jgi:hypothetical protein